MSTLTPNVGLVKPDATENLDRVDHFNDNWVTIDDLFAQTGVGETSAVLAHLRDVALTSSYTGSQSKATLDLQPTWNTSGSMYGVRVQVTHTAAGGNSRPIEVRRGANVIFDVDITTNLAVNGLSVRGGATANPVQLVAVGGDSNIDITLTPKGTGNVKIGDGDLVVPSGTRAFFNDTANANQLDGLTIRTTEASRTELISLKHSLLAHGVTSYTETDTGGIVSTGSSVLGNDGGLVLVGLTEQENGVTIHGVGMLTSTASTSTAFAQVMMLASTTSGTDMTAPGATVNLFGLGSYATAGSTRAMKFLVKGDGDVYNAGGSTAMVNFDSEEDLAIIENFRVLSMGEAPEGYRNDFATHMERAKSVLVERGVITLTADGAIDMVSYKGLMAVVLDTIRQEGYRLRDLEARLSTAGII